MTNIDKTLNEIEALPDEAQDLEASYINAENNWTIVPMSLGGLKALAAAYREKEREWIPVSERLPENEHTKEITYEGPDGLATEYGRYSGGRWLWSDGLPSKVNVIAWRELPPPYTPDEGA